MTVTANPLRCRGRHGHGLQPTLVTYRLRAEQLEARHMLASDLTFADPLLLDVDENPEAVLVADFDGDGHADLVTANYATRNISALLGSGDGTFLPAENYDVGVGPVHIAAGDFDKDGVVDLVVSHVESFSVSVLLGFGDGTFDYAIGYSVGSFAESVAAGDLDGDGNMDLAVTHLDPGGVDILMGEDGGTFAPAITLLNQELPRDVAAADFNHDGDLDLVLANGYVFRDNNDVIVLLGAGDGTFPTVDRYTAGNKPARVVVADFNGDAHPDVAARNSSSSDVSVLLGSGDGTLMSAVHYRVTGTGLLVSLAAGDLNGDGHTDLVTASGGDDSISVLINTGQGTFDSAQEIPAETTPRNVALADLNEDNRLDIVAVTQDTSQAMVFFSRVPGDANADGRFDQLDIVAVLQAGKYITGQPATWGEGDWNRDAVFDQRDLVTALQAGNYLTGPYAAARPRDGVQSSSPPLPACVDAASYGCLLANLAAELSPMEPYQ